MRIETRQAFESEKTQAYAQKPRLKRLFKNSISNAAGPLNLANLSLHVRHHNSALKFNECGSGQNVWCLGVLYTPLARSETKALVPIITQGRAVGGRDDGPSNAPHKYLCRVSLGGWALVSTLSNKMFKGSG
jgi:hypothetical protein